MPTYRACIYATQWPYCPPLPIPPTCILHGNTPTLRATPRPWPTRECCAAVYTDPITHNIIFPGHLSTFWTIQAVHATIVYFPTMFTVPLCSQSLTTSIGPAIASPIQNSFPPINHCRPSQRLPVRPLAPRSRRFHQRYRYQHNFLIPRHMTGR